MKKLFFIVTSGLLTIGTFGIAVADTFVDNFDDQGANGNWLEHVYSTWSYQLTPGTTDNYIYVGTGIDEAPAWSAANQGREYYNNGLSITTVFQYPSPTPVWGLNGAGIFFSQQCIDSPDCTDTPGYGVGVTYFDFNGDGLNEYQLSAVAIETDCPINTPSYVLLNDDGNLVRSTETLFAMNVVVGSDNYDVSIYKYNLIDSSLSYLGGLYDVDLALPYTHGQVGITTEDHANYGYFEVSGDLVPEPVPEPATILLFGTGLAGLTGTSIRRKRKNHN